MMTTIMTIQYLLLFPVGSSRTAHLRHVQQTAKATNARKARTVEGPIVSPAEVASARTASVAATARVRNVRAEATVAVATATMVVAVRETAAREAEDVLDLAATLAGTALDPSAVKAVRVSALRKFNPFADFCDPRHRFTTSFRNLCNLPQNSSTLAARAAEAVLVPTAAKGEGDALVPVVEVEVVLVQTVGPPDAPVQTADLRIPKMRKRKKKTKTKMRCAM